MTESNTGRPLAHRRLSELSSEEKCAVGEASAPGSHRCTFEWLRGEKKRMRRVEEEDVEGSVH